MSRISFKRHRFPPEVIRHAVWLYFRFTFSLRDVEELMMLWTAPPTGAQAPRKWLPMR